MVDVTIEREIGAARISVRGPSGPQPSTGDKKIETFTLPLPAYHDMGPEPQPIDLPTALQLADGQNPEIAFARERIREATVAVARRSQLPGPTCRYATPEHTICVLAKFSSCLCLKRRYGAHTRCAARR